MLLRRLRGISVAALIWAVLWIPLGIGAGVLIYFQIPPSDVIGDVGLVRARTTPLPIIARTAAAWTAWGAVVGVVFALVLVGAERRRTIMELSVKRIALWGALSAILLPVALVVAAFLEFGEAPIGWQFAAISLLTCGFGAVCAAGMLRLAQRGGAAHVADHDSAV